MPPVFTNMLDLRIAIALGVPVHSIEAAVRFMLRKAYKTGQADQRSACGCKRGESCD